MNGCAPGLALIERLKATRKWPIQIERNNVKNPNWPEANQFELPGGYSQKNWVGVCGPLPKTLTLFMTKICDFPYPIYDLTKNLIPYL